MSIATVNPATGKLLEQFEAMTPDEVQAAISRAAETFLSYREVSFGRRAAMLVKAAAILEGRQNELGTLITTEMGKPIGAARVEVAKCGMVCRYYAEHGERYLADEKVESDASESYIRYQPLGIILAVMPWNFPFWQVFRFAAPALMAGNVALLKHASNVPQCALAIDRVFREAGFPWGVFQTLLVGSQAVSDIIKDPRIRAVTLTGSEGAGRSVASTAGANIKKAVLELGGSDPFIVMPSADLEEAVKIGTKARIVNNGQSCIAAKRFIVHRDVASRFESMMTRHFAALVTGDPMDEKTDVGPLATPQIAEELERQVRDSVQRGARLVMGGKRIQGEGNYFEPTILADIPEDAPAAAEETFGPVASLFVVDSVGEAIRLANATSYGLGSSVWTNDKGERKAFIDGIDAGQVFVNAMVASDPRLPFGGVKHSGFGRELGRDGIREFVNVKTVWIQEGAPNRKSSAD
ncbi:MAG TPA: NAD-dependent succinate-semialdehyde dehydrogenase [Thermoanaerobaculia bacterium]|nr:NAD-dependent succinate-semialdehyde dehydrogenase [Thermoanaerobaculia bacterium]